MQKFIPKMMGFFLFFSVVNFVPSYAEQLAYIFDVKDIKTDSVVLPEDKGARLMTNIDSKLFLETKIDGKIIRDPEYLGAFHTDVSVQKLGEDEFSIKIKMQFQFAEFKDRPGVSPAVSSIIEFEVSSSELDKIKTEEFKNAVIDQLANELKNSVFKEAEKYRGSYEPAFKDAFGTKITHYTQQLLYKFPDEIEKMINAYPEEVKKLVENQTNQIPY